MWLRGGINYEPRIGTVWNVPTHGKFWRALQHHLKAGQRNLRNSDTAPGAIAGGHFQIIRSDGPLLVLENLESFKRGAEIPASVLLFFTIDVVLGIAIIEFSVVNSVGGRFFSVNRRDP